MLNDKLKAELQKPFGDLCSHADCAEKLRAYKKIVTVGDITTYTVVQAGIVPDVCIIDGVTMRAKVSDEIYHAISTEPRHSSGTDGPSFCERQQCRVYNLTANRFEASGAECHDKHDR